MHACIAWCSSYISMTHNWSTHMWHVRGQLATEQLLSIPMQHLPPMLCFYEKLSNLLNGRMRKCPKEVFSFRFTCKGKFAKKLAFLCSKELILSVPCSSWAGKLFWCYYSDSQLWLGLHRQEEPHCASVSFDKHAANMFQSYVQSALAFSIKRGGILYGNKDEEGNVTVHAIYEPSQVMHQNALHCCVFGAWAPFSKSSCFQ